MKTKNNIQKTTLKSVAATTGLAVLSLTVNAQVMMNSFFENNRVNHFAMVTENTDHNSFEWDNYSRSFTNAETFAAYLVGETENPLEIEDWMTNENNFGLNSYSLETETEEELNLEDWMMNESNFTAVSYIKAETENPLQVEEWMTNESTFEVYSALLETETEEELMLEDWMIKENTFANTQNESKVTKSISAPISTSTFFYQEVNNESKLSVEGWMINPKVWTK